MSQNPHMQAYRTALAGYQAAMNEEAAKYQNAQLMNDMAGQVEAAQNLANYQAQINALNQMAQPLVNPTQGPKPNKYGLSPEEVEMAHAAIPDRHDIRDAYGSRVVLSADDKEARYAEQKAKYRQMLATGQYSNQTDQGRR